MGGGGLTRFVEGRTLPPMNRVSRLFFRPRKALRQPLRQALLAPACLAGAVLMASPAGGAAAPAGGAADGCSVLVRLYRTLPDAVPAAERQRLVDRILNACGVVDIQLLRASTLDGAAVLEVPAAAFAPGGRP